MKFKDLLIDILLEQQVPPNPEDPEVDPEGNEPEEPFDPDQPWLDADGNVIPGMEPVHDIGRRPPREPNQPQKPEGPKKLSRTQMIKAKWKEENPALSEQQMTDAVDFFNERKDRIRPFHPYGYIDPTTNRHYINLPEIAALAERFPNMIPDLSDPVKVKDLSNYTWEVISFYQDRIYRQAIEMDDENFVKGDFTEDQRIQMALQRWTKPYNQLINEGGVIIYKVECKAEAIALGALDHAIFRKYKSDKVRKNLPPDERAEVVNMTWASQPWCVSRPIGGQYGGNLWTSYRPSNAFYFILDKNKPEWHKHHVAALQTIQGGGYNLSTMTNNTEFPSWDEIETIYPVLRGKKNMFPWFGTTQREKKELTLDVITFRRGDQYDFAVHPDSVHTSYIENGRMIRDVRCFLTLSFDNRKLYIDKATKENDDYKQRFICEDANDPFGILEILRIQKKPDDLYKYLDGFTLKQRLGIPDGINAIKKTIVGTNWRRWLSDIDTNETLISHRHARMRVGDKPRYGIMNIENADLIKDIVYFAETPKSYGHRNEDRTITKYIFQKYVYAGGDGQVNATEYFYFLCRPEAFTVGSDVYLQGKYYNGRDGDAFIQNMVTTGQLVRI